MSIHRALIAVLFVIACAGIWHASGMRVRAAALDEEVFWTLMERSEQLLSNDEAVTQVRDLWLNVDAVRLSDGSLTPVDIRWLVDGIADPEDIRTTRARIRALLAYRAALKPGDGGSASGALSALQRLSERFQYGAPEPYPSGQAVSFSFPIPPGLGEIILIAVGVLAAVAALAYVARGLDVGRADVETSEAQAEDPTTSTGAHDLAGTAEQAGDYRAAVRYLYLAALLTLDEHGMIRYDRTLTNREHLLQVADKHELSDVFLPVINTFERVWYGFAPISEAEYGEYRANVERLHHMTSRR